MIGLKRRTVLLRPLAHLYGLGVRLRNALFDLGLLPSESFSIPIICVGNIAVGGTGKTPHVEQILSQLTPTMRVAVLSRGYKRRTRGLVEVTLQSTCAEVGDEPKQIKLKYPSVQVVVDANRRRAMRYLMAKEEGERPEVVVMDDGFQHRYLKPSFSILLVDASMDLLKEKLLPEGDLREPATARYRASSVVLTKCPSTMKPIELSMKARNLELYAHQQVYYTGIRYAPLRALSTLGLEQCEAVRHGEGVAHGSPILLLTAIANPEPLVQELRRCYKICRHLAYADHHYYTLGDIASLRKEVERLEASQGQRVSIITTEKDAVRLLDHRADLEDDLLDRIYYQPIEIVLWEGVERWREMIRKATQPQACVRSYPY